MLLPIRMGQGKGIEEILLPQRKAILRAARRHGFTHVRVFGSVRRRQATSRSDVDLLVDREPGATVFDQAALEAELEGLLHRKVDVVPEAALHWLLRPQVLFEGVPL